MNLIDVETFIKHETNDLFEWLKKRLKTNDDRILTVQTRNTWQGITTEKFLEKEDCKDCHFDAWIHNSRLANESFTM